MSLTPSSSGFNLSGWIAANAALASRLGAGRVREFAAEGIPGVGGPGGEAGLSSPFSGLTSRSITGGVDDERRRLLARIGVRGGSQESGSASLMLDGGGLAGSGGHDHAGGRSGLFPGADPAGGSVSTAGLLARGYQPAVVKVISYAHGVTRASASAQYIGRDEVELETHEGARLADKTAVAGEIERWSSAFEKRSPSQDAVAVRLQLSGIRDSVEGRVLLDQAIGAAFEGHRHAHRIEVQPDGILEARVVVVMARGITPEERARIKGVTGAPSPSDAVHSPRPPTRLRVQEQRMGTSGDAPSRPVFDPRSEAAMKARIIAATGYPAHGVSLEPGMPGHGREALATRLASLVARGPALDQEAKRIGNADEVRETLQAWNRHLRSQTPRDTMHMIVSAKAGTDVKAFTSAVRSFLHQQFADHRFMFGVHTDKAEAGHIHAHAIVAVRGENGVKLHPGPRDLSQWRVTYAAHAREHGLEVVATRAVEQASSRSYGPKDKSIVEVAERPRPHREWKDRAYAADPANAGLICKARARMEAARADPPRVPESPRQVARLEESLTRWREVAKAEPENRIAGEMLARLSAARAAGEVIGQLRAAANGWDHRATHDAGDTSTGVPSSGRPDTDRHQAGSIQTYPPQTNSEYPAPMSKPASEMLADLRLMNRRVAEVSAMLPEGSRQPFLDRTASAMERIAERVDQQRAAEAKEAARQDANAREAKVELNREALQLAAREQHEALQAQHLADRAIKANRTIETTPPTAEQKAAGIDRSRQTVREAERYIANEARDANAATEAARSIAHDPTLPVGSAPASASPDPRAELRRTQQEMLKKLAKERETARDRERGKGHERE